MSRVRLCAVKQWLDLSYQVFNSYFSSNRENQTLHKAVHATLFVKQSAMLWLERFEMLLTEGDWEILKAFNCKSIRVLISKTEIISQDGFTDPNGVSL